uniref:Uncharacterized protein n=1 Tax=Aquisalinus luteolus TaxID=1566827 RepID=A0A8J3EPN3_9PROT|nr:hypothetical protein GCM10011355_00100 [Aquisalinus luteolus]
MGLLERGMQITAGKAAQLMHLNMVVFFLEEVAGEFLPAAA